MIKHTALLRGHVTFREFQEMALYHPEQGYYMRTRSPFGRTGDFYTAPGVGDLFGETIAGYLYKSWNELLERDKATEYPVVEYGAGDGRLARAVLNWFRNERPEFYQKLVYYIVEVSPRSKTEQKHRLSEHTNIRWADVLPKLDAAIILSNEYVDALPVHLLERINFFQWREIGLQWQNDCWKEVLLQVSDPSLLTYISQYGQYVGIGHRMEANLLALNWLEEIAVRIKRGRLITFDYGAEVEELYPEYQVKGTIRGYRKHRVVSDIYVDPGEMDLTHDVNFTALIRKGQELGWKALSFSTQTHFLMETGMLETFMSNSRFDASRSAAVKHLLFGFPPKFQVLIQGW